MWQGTESTSNSGGNLHPAIILFPVQIENRCGKAEGVPIWVSRCASLLIIHAGTIVLDRFVS